MKKIFLLLFLLLLSAANYAQIHNPVKWSTSVKKISATEYDLIINAAIETNWHLYSQNVPEDGPIPTNFSFEVSKDFQLVGKTSEEDGHTVDDPIFGMKIKYFDTNAIFKQRIKIINKSAITVLGEVEFMVCDDANCLPPTFVDLKFSIPATKTTVENTSKIENNQDLKLVEKKKQSNSNNRSLLGIFIIAFFSGFAALLTPCVFPMIPMTVSFFTKQSKSKAAGIKNAIIYGLSIVVIYVLLGSLVSAIFGADALNALSTNVWFNIIFFLLLMLTFDCNCILLKRIRKTKKY